MKLTFLLILTSLAISCYSQSIDSTTHLVKYEGVIDANGTQSQLFSKAKLWFADAKQTITTEDKDAGFVVGKGYSRLYFTRNLVIGNQKTDRQTTLDNNYTVKLFVKDNRFKYVISDIKMKDDYMNLPINLSENFLKVTNDSSVVNDESKVAFRTSVINQYKAVNDYFKGMINGLIDFMQKKSEGEF